MTRNNDISLELLFDKEDLSIRSKNICQTSGITSLAELIVFYQTHKTFLKIRNCGRKTDIELKAVCEKYLKNPDQIIPVTEIKNQSPSNVGKNENLEDLDPFYKLVINRYIQFLYNRLPPRSKHGLDRFLNYQFDFNSILKNIIQDSIEFTKIENVGNRTSSELIKFKDRIKYFIKTIKKYSLQELNEEYTRILINSYFSKELFEGDQVKMFYEKEKLQLFKLLYFLLSNKVLLRDKRLDIFMLTFLDSDSPMDSDQAIGKNLGLTRERIRQLKIQTEKEVNISLRVIENFEIGDIIDYGINTNNELIVIDDDLKEKINSEEHVNFNLDFYKYAFGTLLKNTHFLLGSISFDNESNRRSQNLSRKYLIDNIYSFFNFNSFLASVYAHFHSKKEETYSFPFKGYLFSFLIDKNYTVSEALVGLCEMIILYEFGMTLDSESCLLFERNTKKQNYEYVQEALEIRGSLMEVNEILSFLREKYPEMDFQEHNVRMCLREKDIFIYIGRTSTYGLKKWEAEIQGLKGGTIRDMVEEFLRTCEEPKHIFEITKYVNQYRQTTERSIDTNIVMDESSRFIFFNAGFVGLKTKNYSSIDTNYKRPNGSWFILNNLKAYNNLDYEDFIFKLASLYDLKPIQIEAIIENKIESEQIRLTQDNKIHIP